MNRLILQATRIPPVWAKLLTPQDRLLAYPWSSYPWYLAARLRHQTTLSVKQIAECLHLGKPKGARTNLHRFMKNPPAEISPM